jgi:hypothetical protein
MTDQNREPTIANEATTAKRTKKNAVAAEAATKTAPTKPKPKVATKQVLQDRNNSLEDEVSRLRGMWHVGVVALGNEN